ncbi:MAG: right-handed parallel beta-helix repeat-containing protein, partial [Akkermansiaceae bacterium]|nr:right-handed parallel beta-helix repeat-containing protein [Akkermansiaceae bacterium]
LTEARKILGLGAEEDPRPHLGEFRSVREKIADMVRTAPNDQLEERYQEGLVEFDQAMAVMREHLEALGLAERVPDVVIEDVAVEEKGSAVFVAANEVADGAGLPVVSHEAAAVVSGQAVAEEEDPEPSTGKLFRLVVVILVLLSLAGFGGWGYLKIQERNEMEKRERVVFLERQGAIFSENRRWPEATETFDEIESIYPDSDLVMMGRRSIEAGMVEEQNQFIGYWKGEAIAAFDASRWDDSEKAAQQVLEKYPDEKELTELIGRIAVAKREEERQKAFEVIVELIEKRSYDEAVSKAEKLTEENASDRGAAEILKRANAAKAKAEADLERARMLLAQATERDKGEFDEEALEWIREAVSLAPDDAEILAKYEKMAAYTRTIRVPEEFNTVGEALQAARDKDRIVVGEGVWEGPFFLNVAAEIEGVSGKTVMQCEADKGCVITIGAGAIGARLSGVTLKHESFDAGEERFSLVLLSGGQADFSDCLFEKGSGHGLAVTGGGKAKVQRCRFTENGWNGIAVMGAGSFLEAEENTLKGNFQNGIEGWDDGSLLLTKNQCTGNSRNGIHVDNGESAFDATGNILSENREFGIVISSGGSGKVTNNTMEKNFLGGMVIKAAASAVVVSGNEIRANNGSGMVLEKGLSKESYEGNRVGGNNGKDWVLDADLTVD